MYRSKQLSPETLSDQERLQEVANLLATAIIRQKTDTEESTFSLDFSPPGSVHGKPHTQGEG